MACLAGVSAGAETRRAPEGYTRNVAIVVYQGVELLDFAGPGEVFKSAAGRAGQGRKAAFNVFTVATSNDPIVSQGFVKVTPQYSVETSPKPDIVVIPGGGSEGLLGDARLMAWLDKASREAEITLTVCTGAFVLAKQGRLDGREVTSFYGAIDGLRAAAPKAIVQDGRRYVDSGDVVTTAGVSAGIDGSLHVVARLLGRAVADQTARYMEYHWTPDSYMARRYTLLNPSLDEASRQLQQGDLRYDEDDYEGAEREYRALLNREPKNAGAWYRLGRSLLAQRKYAEGATANLHATADADYGPQAWFNLGCAYARLGQKDEAFLALGRALDTGFDTKWMLQEDDDLQGLRADARFEKLLARL